MFVRALYYKVQRKLTRSLFPNRRIVVPKPKTTSSGYQILPRTFTAEAFWVKTLTCLSVILFVAMWALLLFLVPFFGVAFSMWLLLYLAYCCAEDHMIKLLDKHCVGDKGTATLRHIRTFLLALRVLRSSHAREEYTSFFFYVCLAVIILCSPDTPVIIPAEIIPFSYLSAVVPLSIVICVFLAHFGRRTLSQATLVRAGDRLRRREQFASELAQEKMKKMNAILGEFNSYGHIDFFTSFFKSSIAEKEAEIQCLFEYPATETITLNCLILICKLETLLLKIRDRGGRNSRSMLIDLLCIERVDELDVRSRALVLHAIMSNRLSCAPLAEEAIKNVILKTHGDDLSILKSMTDAKGSVHSFYKLVFEDVSENTREAILAHCHREATLQVAMRSLTQNKHFYHLISKNQDIPIELEYCFAAENVAYTGKQTKHAWRKILTDMDDTLLCSGGWYPAGIDTRYPRNVLYPGVTTFLHALEETLVEAKRVREWWMQPSTAANRVSLKLDEAQEISDETHLVGLSARPHIPGDHVEARVFSEFERMQKEHGLRSMPTLLTGAIDTGGAFMFTGELEYLGERKFEKFCQYLTLYPEFVFIFIGDNGQADLYLALLILEKFPYLIEQVYVHLVQPITGTLGYAQFIALPLELQQKVYFYTDYIAAAIHAATRAHQLISLGSLWRIAVAAVNDFDQIKNWTSADQRSNTGAKLNKTITRANAVLRGASVNLPPIRYLDLGDEQADATTGMSPAVRTSVHIQTEIEPKTETVKKDTAVQTDSVDVDEEKADEAAIKFLEYMTHMGDRIHATIDETIDHAKNIVVNPATGKIRSQKLIIPKVGISSAFESCTDLSCLSPDATSADGEKTNPKAG
eukprot:GEMP01001860.1.p1 GENE.GEMP01001860.1~~GEMP01001860.1.p1  ORF type:complete len:864 (+),score=126.58 GEMP01001860.1:112-2703(+)